MQWYIQNVLCYECKKPANLRQFQFNGKGEIKLIGWCTTCGRESVFITESAKLHEWAHHKDNPFPSDKDKIFLKELLVSWDKASE